MSILTIQLLIIIRYKKDRYKPVLQFSSVFKLQSDSVIFFYAQIQGNVLTAVNQYGY